MRKVKFLFVIVALLFAGSNAEAQLLKKVGKAVKNAAERTVERKAEQKTEEAVVDKLVEMGIAKDRLTSAGKGQNSPIADNSTDEGRAKNRRVEFVKIM